MTEPSGERTPARSPGPRALLGRAVPILRIFDVNKARVFYLDYLGLTVDWEHRFIEGGPLYMQVSRDDLVLHLSEHHGDGTPGSVVYTEISGVDQLHRELADKQYPDLNPGISADDSGACLTLIDPFGNTLRLNEPMARVERGRASSGVSTQVDSQQPGKLESQP